MAHKRNAINGGNGGEGVTLLMYACQQGHETEVRHILSKKPATVWDKDRTGKTALHYCAENSNLNCIDQVMSVDSGIIDLADEEGYTALHLAVISGNRAIVRYLVNKGADLRRLDNEKHSLIHWATVCGEIECLAILNEAGANPSTSDIHGAYPIHYAAQMCGPNSELGNDVKTGLLALKRLLTYGVDVNVKDQDGRQPLLWAASAGSSDAILALVNSGANVFGRDKDGLTALHCAASRGHNECLEALYTLCGAELDAKDNNGCTSLFYAVTLGHADCTEVLLKFGSEYNRQDRKGRTPAHCGAAKGQLETLKILSKHGANLWMKNMRGDYPLHDAVHSGRKDLVLWLLEQRPESVNAANNDGRTPLHIAASNNNVEMVKVLLDNRANINPVMRNSKGQLMTPLDVALSRGRGSCAKYLQLSGAVPASKLSERNRGTSDSQLGHLTNGSSPDHDSLTLSENIANYLDRSDPTASVGSPHDHKASQVDLFKESLKDQGSQTLQQNLHGQHGHQPRGYGLLHHGVMTAKDEFKQKQPDRTRYKPAHQSENVSPISGGTLTTQKDSGISDTHALSDRGDYSDFDSDNPSLRGGSDPLPSSDNDTLTRRRRHRTARVPARRGVSDNGYDKHNYRSSFEGKIVGDGGGTKSLESRKMKPEIESTIQSNMKRYQRERRIFQMLLELKRLQIRGGKSSEQITVKRLAETYAKEGLTVNDQRFQGPNTYRAFDNYLYDQLRLLSNTGNGKVKTVNGTASGNMNKSGADSNGNEDDPAKCTHRTYQCHHAAHAYTGIPCAAFIRPKQHKDTFLPQIFPAGKDGHSFNVKDLDPKESVTLEIKQGKDKKAFALPTDNLDKNKRFQVTFTIGLPSAPPIGRNGPVAKLKPLSQNSARNSMKSL